MTKELRNGILHVEFLEGVDRHHLSVPRRYTLTHSDTSGHLFLSVGREFNREQVSGLYTRLMRDEVLAEWRGADGAFQLHVLCHVSGGLVLGSARMRLGIFRQHMRLVLEALRHGDGGIYASDPDLDGARAMVHFCSPDPRVQSVQDYGPLSEYR